MLQNADPVEAERLLELAQDQVMRRWLDYEKLATQPAEAFAADARKED